MANQPVSASVTFTATANKGYVFAGRYNAADTSVSAQNPYTFSLAADITLTVKFAEDNGGGGGNGGNGGGASTDATTDSGVSSGGTSPAPIGKAAGGTSYMAYNPTCPPNIEGAPKADLGRAVVNGGKAFIAVEEENGLFFIYDEDGTPLGYVVLEPGRTLDDIDIMAQLIPFGTAKPNPKTGAATRATLYFYVSR